MAAVLRTRTLSETRGFLKALVEEQSDRILGFTALGAQAGESIAVVQTAMLAGAPYTALRDAILTHPDDRRRAHGPVYRRARRDCDPLIAMAAAFDAIVIGTGQAGPALAARLARRRHESRGDRARASSAAPASTTAARPPRRWWQAPTPRNSRGAAARVWRASRGEPFGRHEAGEGAQGRHRRASRAAASSNGCAG